jgi:hypothetical protein
MHHGGEETSAVLVIQRSPCDVCQGPSCQRCPKNGAQYVLLLPTTNPAAHLLRLPEEPLEVLEPEDLELLLPDGELLRDEREPEDREPDDRDGDLDLPMATLLPITQLLAGRQTEPSKQSFDASTTTAPQQDQDRAASMKSS